MTFPIKYKTNSFSWFFFFIIILLFLIAPQYFFFWLKHFNLYNCEFYSINKFDECKKITFSTTVRNKNQLISNKYCMALVFKKRFVLLKQRIHITESLICFLQLCKMSRIRVRRSGTITLTQISEYVVDGLLLSKLKSLRQLMALMLVFLSLLIVIVLIIAIKRERKHFDLALILSSKVSVKDFLEI